MLERLEGYRKTGKALITGIGGQDGSYMAELLLYLGYEVHGIVRRCSIDNLERIRHIEDRLILHQGDLSDHRFVRDFFSNVRSFDIVYNFAAQSHVHTSFRVPGYTLSVNFGAVGEMLSLLWTYSPKTRFYQASTSEMFGSSPPPQGISTPFVPLSPYANAKLRAHHAVNFYRGLGLFAVSGILFNHESPRRGVDFVTRKITKAVGEFYTRRRERSNPLTLGSLSSRRDWGFAPEYVILIHQQMMKDDPQDFVIGTGEVHSVEDFLKACFEYVGLSWRDFVVSDDPAYIRPNEIPLLQAQTDIKTEIKFDRIVEAMVRHDCGMEAPSWYASEYSPIFAWR